MDSGDEPLPIMTTSTFGLDYFWTPIMAYFSAPIDTSSVRQDIAPIMQVQEPTHAELLVQEIQRVQISVGVGDRKDRADR